jgi:sulfatase maturation enzyme AslB (radical SAM superfamily)
LWLKKQFVLDSNEEYFHITPCAITGKNMGVLLPVVDCEEDINASINNWLDMREQLIEQIRRGIPRTNGFCENCAEIYFDTWDEVKDFTNFSISIYPSPCNLKCRYCLYWKSGALNARGLEQAVTKVEQVFNELRKRELLANTFTIYLCSGEYSVHPYKQIIQKLFKDGHILGLTNSVIYDETLAQKLKDGLSTLIISVDAGTHDTYERLRGVDAFEKVCENIKRYTKCGNVRIKYILLKDINDNDNDWQGVIDFLHSIKHNELEIATDSVKTIHNERNREILPGLARFMRTLRAENIEPAKVDFYLCPDDVKELRTLLGKDFQYNWR